MKFSVRSLFAFLLLLPGQISQEFILGSCRKRLQVLSSQPRSVDKQKYLISLLEGDLERRRWGGQKEKMFYIEKWLHHAWGTWARPTCFVASASAASACIRSVTNICKGLLSLYIYIITFFGNLILTFVASVCALYELPWVAVIILSWFGATVVALAEWKISKVALLDHLDVL